MKISEQSFEELPPAIVIQNELPNMKRAFSCDAYDLVVGYLNGKVVGFQLSTGDEAVETISAILVGDEWKRGHVATTFNGRPMARKWVIDGKFLYEFERRAMAIDKNTREIVLSQLREIQDEDPFRS